MTFFHKITILILPFIVCSCSYFSLKTQQEPIEDVVAEVNGIRLYDRDLETIMPQNISTDDSARYADAYIRKWVMRELLFEHANRNVGNTEEIERMVENYRQSLMIHEYQQHLIDQKVKNPSEKEMLQYYNQHADNFKLKEPLLQGIFLKIPLNAPKLNELRRKLPKYQNNMADIEKYGYQNAAIYEYFDETWKWWSEFENRMPKVTSLKKGLIELTDEEYRYLLFIVNISQKGDVMPFDFAKREILPMLKEQKSLEFIHKFEDELYESALKKGTIILPQKNETK